MDELPAYLRDKIKVNKNGCWEWKAALDRNGYGRVHIAGTANKAGFSHRIVYQLFYGTLPLELDHLCRNPCCCNPKHLESVTHKVNVRRGLAAQATRTYYANHLYCPKAHPLFGENLYAHTNRFGYVNKQCRTCRRDTKRARRLAGAKD